MLYSIDRFEGDVAVLVDENENTVNVARSLLPTAAHSGDMLRFADGCYTVATDATASRRARVLNSQAKLRRTKK